MRLTTKIVLGIFLSIFLLILGFIIIFSFTDKVNYGNSGTHELTISQESIVSRDVAPYKTILLETEWEDEYNAQPCGTIYVRPITIPSEENKLILSEELAEFTDIVSLNDTLIIRLKMKELNDRYSISEYIYTKIDGVDFYVHTNAVDIKTDLSGIDIDIRGIKTDKIKINASGKLNIEDCQANIIEPYMEGYRRAFSLKNSQIKELKMDLDIMDSWIVENSDIEVENLTGSKTHSVQLSKNEAKVVNWIPKNEDAKLNVTLLGDTARIVFP